jgi:putative membrane protein
MMLFIVPNALFALFRYLTYTYTYGETELVIRSGLLFRRERHIPYSRIQNIDAVQNPLHRLLRVVEVKLETGGGDKAEATMSVLPMAAFHDMRERVFAKRHLAEPESGAVAAAPLVALSVPDLLLCGFIENRGGVLIAAALGVVWEMGLFDRLFASLTGGTASGRGVIRSLARSVYANATVSWGRLALALTGFLVLLLVIRVVSMIWAVVRLYGFKVTLIDDDARAEFGLLTRVSMSIPMRRIQVLTVRESPLHRWCDRISVRVDTAGGGEPEQEPRKKGDREYLAPILPRPALTGFVQAVIGVDLASVAWNAPHPNAFRREVKPWLAMSAVAAAALGFLAKWFALPFIPLLLAWAVIGARQTIKYQRWAEVDDALLSMSGWLWRRLVIVRFGKMQVVTLRESPFDRRHRMAALHVDTAGASDGSAVHIRYLARPIAEALHSRLVAAAAGTQFRW